jgi:hypothetical protein
MKRLSSLYEKGKGARMEAPRKYPAIPVSDTICSAQLCSRILLLAKDIQSAEKSADTNGHERTRIAAVKPGQGQSNQRIMIGWVNESQSTLPSSILNPQSSFTFRRFSPPFAAYFCRLIFWKPPRLRFQFKIGVHPC